MAQLRSLLVDDSDAILGFERDSTLALDFEPVAICLGATGLEVVKGDDIRRRESERVALFRPEKVDADRTVWRVFDASRALLVQGAPMADLPFALLQPFDVISRHDKLRLRFEDELSLVSFGAHENTTLLNPLVGTWPFVFRSAIVDGESVDFGHATYGATGMQIVRRPPAGHRLGAIVSAIQFQKGEPPPSVVYGFLREAMRLVLDDEARGRLTPIPAWWLTTDGRLTALYTTPAHEGGGPILVLKAASIFFEAVFRRLFPPGHAIHVALHDRSQLEAAISTCLAFDPGDL